MKAFIFNISFAAVLLGAASRLPAQAPVVTVTLQPDTVMIGDHILLNVEVDKDMVQVIGFPSFEDGSIGGPIEILTEFPADTLSREGRRVTIRKRYLLTCFDEGHYALGRFPVLYLDKNITDTVYSADSMYLHVNTFDIDTATMDIYDIKAPIHTPVLKEEFMGYLTLGYYIAQILGAIGYLLWRKAQESRHKPRKKLPPAIPPHVLAIRSLEQLQSEKLWQNNRHKLYYTRLTDIVREYIEGRYGIYAMEMTSDEIMASLAEIGLEKRSLEQIGRLLSTADYVKFAKYLPSVEDNEMSYDDAYYFVEDTKVIAPDGSAPAGGKEEQP